MEVTPDRMWRFAMKTPIKFVLLAAALMAASAGAWASRV